VTPGPLQAFDFVRHPRSGEHSYEVNVTARGLKSDIQQLANVFSIASKSGVPGFNPGTPLLRQMKIRATSAY